MSEPFDSPAAGQPIIVSIDEQEWTDEQIEQFAAEWRRKVMTGEYRLKLLTPLPRRVRFRLWRERQVHRAAIWLIDRGRFGAAERLWRAFGMRR